MHLCNWFNSLHLNTDHAMTELSLIEGLTALSIERLQELLLWRRRFFANTCYGFVFPTHWQEEIKKRAFLKVS